MREILFRGKRVDNGQWIHGDLFGKSCIIAEELGIEMDSDYWAHSYGYPPSEENFHLTGIIEVIRETIGQFTGKHDTNGKMIFEKDKIKWAGEDTIYSVEFEGGSFICVFGDTSFNLSDYADCEYELI